MGYMTPGGYGDVERFADNRVHRIDASTDFAVPTLPTRVQFRLLRHAREIGAVVTFRFSETEPGVMWCRFARRGQDPRFEMPDEGKARCFVGSGRYERR